MVIFVLFSPTHLFLFLFLSLSKDTFISKIFWLCNDSISKLLSSKFFFWISNSFLFLNLSVGWSNGWLESILASSLIITTLLLLLLLLLSLSLISTTSCFMSSRLGMLRKILLFSLSLRWKEYILVISTSERFFKGCSKIRYGYIIIFIF